MIKVVKLFSYNRNIVPWGLSALVPVYIHVSNDVILKCLLLLNRSSNYHRISHGALCRKGIDSLFKWIRATKQDGRLADIW